MAEDSRNKIIFADDDFFMRRVVEEILVGEFPQFQFEFFEDGTSLERKLNDGISNVRLIVTDNSMPGIHGSELIRLYSSKLKERKIPMILHYGGHEGIGQEAVRNGAFAYLLKPMGIRLLPEIIVAALSHPDYQT